MPNDAWAEYKKKYPKTPTSFHGAAGGSSSSAPKKYKNPTGHGVSEEEQTLRDQTRQSVMGSAMRREMKKK